MTKLEFIDGTPATPPYLTFRMWQRLMVKQMVAEYECEVEDALLCLDRKRWVDNHVRPLMRIGEQPSIAVLKSMVSQGLSLGQLQREFAGYNGLEKPFIPEYVDLQGRVIKRIFNVSRPRRRKQ